MGTESGKYTIPI